MMTQKSARIPSSFLHFFFLSFFVEDDEAAYLPVNSESGVVSSFSLPTFWLEQYKLTLFMTKHLVCDLKHLLMGALCNGVFIK